jgi:hypothetical protein
VVEIVVYVFPIDVEKVRRMELDAGKCEEKVKALGLTPKNVDPTWREEAKTVKRLRAKAGRNLPEDWVQRWLLGRISPEDIEEVDEQPSIIVVDPELGFRAEDIAEDFSFGNGCTIGGVRLKDGRWVECGFVVLDHADKAKADELLPALKKIFKGLG